MNSGFETIKVTSVIDGKKVDLVIHSSKDTEGKSSIRKWRSKIKKVIKQKIVEAKEEEADRGIQSGGGGVIFNPFPPPPVPEPEPVQDWTDFIGNPNLTLFGSDCFVDETNTLHTNWNSQAYPYNYAYISDNDGSTDFDVGDSLTITMLRKTHPEETDTFAPLISKWTGSQNVVPEVGYYFTTYSSYGWAYLDDGTDENPDSHLIMNVGVSSKDVWEHYTLVLDRTDNSISYYKDGVFKGKKSNLVEFPPADTSLRILVGAVEGSYGAITPHRAMWRDIRFYKRILTDDEIATISNEVNRG